MDDSGDDWRGWATDGVAAGLLALAIGTCLLWLGEAQAGVAAASVCGLATLALLRRVMPEPLRFRLPQFALPEPYAADEPLLLTDLAPPAEEVMLLEDRLDPPASDSRVVSLFAARPLPTPGELRQRIEAHLTAPKAPRGVEAAIPLEVDAAAALRHALGELRRSLG